MIFFSAALAHLLAVMSPGPDTAIIFHQSFSKGRVQGILTALGIGFGIFIHCFFAISGISLLIYSSAEVKFFIKCLGALYLLYLGISFFISKKSSTRLLDFVVRALGWRRIQSSSFLKSCLALPTSVCSLAIRSSFFSR